MAAGDPAVASPAAGCINCHHEAPCNTPCQSEPSISNSTMDEEAAHQASPLDCASHATPHISRSIDTSPFIAPSCQCISMPASCSPSMSSHLEGDHDQACWSPGTHQTMLAVLGVARLEGRAASAPVVPALGAYQRRPSGLRTAVSANQSSPWASLSGSQQADGHEPREPGCGLDSVSVSTMSTVIPVRVRVRPS